MAILKGDKVVYAIRFTDEQSTEQMLRVLYQTSGNRSISSDDVEINTKDIDGVDYGATTETIGFEGLVSTDDPALEQLELHIKGKKFAEILEINIETLKAKAGKYKISSLEFDYPDEESATYTFEATLIGETTEETLTEVPEGATSID